jgi:hypothetical protein
MRLILPSYTFSLGKSALVKEKRSPLFMIPLFFVTVETKG